MKALGENLDKKEKQKKIDEILKNKQNLEAILRIKGANEIRRKFFKLLPVEKIDKAKKYKIADQLTTRYWTEYEDALHKIGYKSRSEYKNYCNDVW